MQEPITIIDRDVLKVLSAETRMDILKEIYKGSRWPSDLGKLLNKKDSTIVEHLEALVKVGLVKKLEQPGKKWIFYSLTDKGESIISSKSKRLVIILSISILSIAGGLFSLFTYQKQKMIAGITIQQKVQEAASAPAIAQQAIMPTYTPTPLYLYIAIILFVLGLIGITFYLIKQHKRGIKLWKE